jgi:hypothetical protein
MGGIAVLLGHLEGDLSMNKSPMPSRLFSAMLTSLDPLIERHMIIMP